MTPGSTGSPGSWSRYCHCARWVEASRCAGNSSAERVFVHEDDLPEAVQRFRFLSEPDHINCWTIDPAGPRVCLLQDAYTYRGPFDYDGCAACEDPDDDAPDGGGGGGGGGGSGGGGGGSGGGGGWPGGPGSTPEGIKISVCAGHEQRAADRGWKVGNLYWPASEEFEESFVANVGGICVSVPTGPVVTEPDPAYWVGGGTRYETCSDCTDGHQAKLCLDDQELPGAEDAPELWIRQGDHDPEVTGFEWGVWCYQIPAGPSLIPEGARLVNPTQDLPCDSCNRGVLYQRCPGEPDPGQPYWAEQGDIDDLLAEVPGLTTVWMKIAGVCHSLDLAATPQRIPLDAVRVAPRCGYASCAACQCSGEPAPECADRERGIPVRLCTGQSGEDWRDTWLAEGAIPGGVRWFAHRGFCVFVNPADPISPIPASAEVLRSITHRYDDCADCLAGTGGGGGGGGGGTDPPDPCEQYPPGNPLRPWWCDPLPPFERYFQLRDCQSGQFTGEWVREDHLCGRFNVVPCDIAGTVWKAGLQNKCYEAAGPPQPEALGPVVDAKIRSGPLSTCTECSAGVCWHRWESTWDCEAGAWGAVTHAESRCVQPGDADPSPTMWVLTTGDGCTAQKWTRDSSSSCTSEPPAPGECPEPAAPAGPALSEPSACCGPGMCWHRWSATWDCDTSVWSTPQNTHTQCLSEGDPAPGLTSWTRVAGTCEWELWVQEGSGCSPPDVEGCPFPAAPGLPASGGEACCAGCQCGGCTGFTPDSTLTFYREHYQCPPPGPLYYYKVWEAVELPMTSCARYAGTAQTWRRDWGISDDCQPPAKAGTQETEEVEIYYDCAAGRWVWAPDGENLLVGDNSEVITGCGGGSVQRGSGDLYTISTITLNDGGGP